MDIGIEVAIFGILIGIVALFQVALAAGMPWGMLSMGGRFPGRFPLAMRFVCLLQIGVLALLAAIVFARAGLILPEWAWLARGAIWGVVIFCTIALIANLLTPSKWERNIWAPVTAVLLTCSLFVAID